MLAEALYAQHFSGKKAPESEVLATVKGSDLVGLRYEQLIPWAQPMSDADQAFRVIAGDFRDHRGRHGHCAYSPHFWCR